MVNLIRYRERADYRGRLDLPPCSGRDAFYTRYLPAFAEVAQGRPFAIRWVGAAHATVVAPDGEAWDDVATVE